MSEDDVIRKLARFRPTAGADRDDLLFAAGRASVRSPRRWKWAAGLLAASQAATLGLLVMSGQAGGVNPLVETPTGGFTPPARPEPDPPSEPLPDSYLVLSRTWNPDRPPPAVAAGLPPARPLTLWSARTGELP